MARFLCHLMQHENKIILLFCGTHKIEEMAADYWSIFFNTALYYRLSHLKRKDAIRLIKEPVVGYLNHDALAVEQILKMSGCQPYLIQLICHTVVNHLNDKKKRNDALVDDVDEAVEFIISNGSDQFSQQIWSDASKKAKVILSAMAEEMKLRLLDRIGIERIFTAIKKIAPEISRPQMMDTLNKLVNQEIIAEKNMVYYFPVSLLQKWIAIKYPLRKVREEL